MHEGESKKQLSNASKTYFRNSHLKALSMIETFGLAAYGNTLDNKFTDGYLFGLKTALADIEKRKRTHERISRELSDNIIRSQLETIVFDEATREAEMHQLRFWCLSIICLRNVTGLNLRLRFFERHYSGCAEE